MAQPYFTNQPVPIQQVSPELLMAPGRAMGRAFEKLGQSVAGAMERQELKKQKEQQRQSVEAFLLNQGFDPDEANLMSRDKDVAFNASKALREQQQFEQTKKYQEQLIATSRANEKALLQALTQKEEERLGRKQAREAQRGAVLGEGKFADTFKYLQEQHQAPVSQYAADEFIKQNDPTSPLPYTYTAPPKPTSLDVILKQEMTSDAKTQFDKWTKHSNELSSLKNTLLRTENPIDRAKIKRKIDYKTKFLERAENRIGKLEEKNEFFKDKPKEEFTESYINRVLAQQGLSSPEQQRRITGEQEAFASKPDEVLTTVQETIKEKGLEPTPQNIYLESLANPEVNEYAIEELKKQIPKIDIKEQKQILEMEKAMLDIREKKQKLKALDFSDIAQVKGGEFNSTGAQADIMKNEIADADTAIGLIQKLESLSESDMSKLEKRAAGEVYSTFLRSALRTIIIGTGAVSDAERKLLETQVPNTEAITNVLAFWRKNPKRLTTLKAVVADKLSKKMKVRGLELDTSALGSSGGEILDFSNTEAQSKYSGGVVNFQTGQ